MVAEAPGWPAVSEVSGRAAQPAPTPQRADTQPWPARSAAYYALAVIILATALNFLDQQVFYLLAQRIKVDLHLTDEQLGFLVGFSNVIFYVIVGIPLARLVDLYPRKYVLAGGVAITGGITALGGLAQSFAQLFSSRMLVGAGGSAHAPGAYSMLADYFPPARLPRAIGILQLGFIGGNTLGIYLGGALLALGAVLPASLFGLSMHSWQWVLVMVGTPGIAIAILMLFVKEPPRRGSVRQGQSLPLSAVLREIWARRRIYLPLFIGLAFSATESFGLQAWRSPFLIRTYGWTEMQVASVMSVIYLVFSLLGAFLGTVFVEWLSKRYKDANVRASAILFALTVPFEVIAPLMPNGLAASLCLGCALMCGLASAVPQNAAIQRITPNDMRGLVTAIYLFMFIFFGAAGGQMIGSVTQRVFHSDADLWKSMILTAAILMPLAAFSIALGIKPYGREVERLDALEAQRR